MLNFSTGLFSLFDETQMTKFLLLALSNIRDKFCKFWSRKFLKMTEIKNLEFRHVIFNCLIEKFVLIITKEI